MAKKGMRRAHNEQPHESKPHNTVALIQGKAKSGEKKARPIIAGTEPPALKVYHSKPHSAAAKADSAIDTDLAFDNMANDLAYADLQDQ